MVSQLECCKAPHKKGKALHFLPISFVCDRRNFWIQRKVQDILAAVANYFGDLIKKETGKSAQEYIQLTTIDRAKELLIEGNMSVSEIAYELGFKYPHHLSRLFKKVVGVAPNEYRVTN